MYSFGDDILCFVHLLEKGGSLAFTKRDGSFYLCDSLGSKTFSMEHSRVILGLTSTQYAKSWSFACQARRGYYIGTLNGKLYLFEPGTNAVFEILNLEQSVCWIQEDRPGLIWVATVNGLSRWDGRQFTTYRQTDGLADNNVRCIYEDSVGQLWFGTRRGGVSAGMAGVSRPALPGIPLKSRFP